MALGVVSDKIKIYHLLRYIIYEFLKKFRVFLDRSVWAPVGKDPLCSVPCTGVGQIVPDQASSAPHKNKGAGVRHAWEGGRDPRTDSHKLGFHLFNYFHINIFMYTIESQTYFYENTLLFLQVCKEEANVRTMSVFIQG